MNQLAIILVYLAVAFTLAFLAESFVEYFFGTLMEKIEKLRPHKWALMYIAALVGVAMAFQWRIDLIYLISGIVAQMLGMETFIIPTPFGLALSGLGIGRGSNFLHGLIQKYAVKPVLPETK